MQQDSTENLKEKLEEQGQGQDKQKTNEDLNRVIFKLAKFLFNKNLLEQFKKEHSREKLYLTSIQSQIQKLPPKKKGKKKKQPKLQKEKDSEQQDDDPEPINLSQLEISQTKDDRWKMCVKSIEEFVKNEYYLYENMYYKLKSASYTMFQYHFKLDVVNTRSNRREELVLTKNKKIFWVSTKKIQIRSEQDSFFIKLPNQEICCIENPVHLQAIKKYWNKATFYAVVPTTASDEPCPEIIMIEFNY